MTVEEFRTKYKEFDATPDAVIEEALADAELFTSDTYGGRRDLVVGLKAADQLSGSPQGRKTRHKVESKSEVGTSGTPYASRLKAIQKAHGWAHNRT